MIWGYTFGKPGRCIRAIEPVRRAWQKAPMRWITSLAFVAIAAGAAFAQSAPSPLAQAVATTQAAKADYTFDFQLETSKQNWRARFMPGAAPRLRLVSPQREELDGGERRAFDGLAERMEGVSWCASENIGRVGNMRLLREDAETATYSFQPTRESVSGEGGRFADRLRGEMTMTKQNPDVSHVRLFAPEPFSPIPLTRLDALNIVIRCQPAPNGRRYAAETVMEMRGSAFGQDFNERSVQRASNLAAP